jgi:hypothetical protein
MLRICIPEIILEHVRNPFEKKPNYNGRLDLGAWRYLGSAVLWRRGRDCKTVVVVL